ncbi:MAG: tRNA (guanosine(37)-N1)-methyltransferase TrmD [Gemmatimonadota bacterium]|nr:MAG: tRNA (guanosine(37)-N1)-methyltransferase TrmD [Gemmatimonadota bacterium]
MRIDVLTIFPHVFESPLQESIVRRARENDLIEIHICDFRDYAPDKHRKVDDYPYGGGPGMVLRPEPIAACLTDIFEEYGQGKTILLSPQGRQFTQELAKSWAAEDHLIIICGHYKGVDERIRLRYVHDEISIGDYVLTGGELPALVLIDAVTRLVPGVIGDLESAEGDSFFEGLLDHPHYTRPEEFHGMRVPDVLLSGHHEHIRKWRRKESLRRTYENRPELLEEAQLNKEDLLFLEEIRMNFETTQEV